MKKLMSLIVVFLLIFGSIGLATANTIRITDGIATHTEVDHWFVSIQDVSTLTIDVLATEGFTGGGGWGGDFFNNGGGNDRLDSFIYLFDYSGNVIGSNDDTSVNYDQNNSTHYWDSYLSITDLAAGNYMLAIGDHMLYASDAWNGYNTAYEGNAGLGLYHIDFISSTGGMTVTDYPVPEPTTMLLLGTGLIGLAGVRRRKK